MQYSLCIYILPSFQCWIWGDPAEKRSIIGENEIHLIPNLASLILPFLLNQKTSTVLTVPAADRIVLVCLSFLIEISVKGRLTNVRDGQKGSLLSGFYFLLYHKQADKWRWKGCKWSSYTDLITGLVVLSARWKVSLIVNLCLPLLQYYYGLVICTIHTLTDTNSIRLWTHNYENNNLIRNTWWCSCFMHTWV
jgi:hypothetical protein